MSKKIKNSIIALTCIVLIVIPLLTNKNGYTVGGDDTKLYYVFPKQFLTNYSFSIVSDNTLAGANSGYYPVSYFAPLVSIFLLLKIIPINTQFLIFGLNLAAGFFFLFKILELLHFKDRESFFISYVSALFYIFSPFLAQTLYGHQLLSLYLIGTMPAVGYFLLKAFKTNNYRYTLVASIIFSVFSTTLNALPWIAGFIVASLPVALYIFFAKKNFSKQIFIFGISSLLLNFYWIFFFIHSQIASTGLKTTTETYASKGFVADNLRIIENVSRLFSPLSQIFQSPQQNGFPSGSLIVFSASIFLIIILIGLMFTKGRMRKISLVVLTSFLLSWFLYSPNLGSWGPKIFVFLSRNVPFFTMFRNMFDKFSLPFAFYYSLLFGISMVSFYKRFSRKIFKVLVWVILVGFTISFAKAVFFNSKGISGFSGTFNSDYMQLVSYFKNSEDQSRVLFLPLNSPTYANIEDNTENGYFYSGLSPFHLLTGKSDYVGRFSFITPEDIFFGEKIFNSINSKNYKEVGEAFMHLNARYIVIDHAQLPKDIAEFMYGGKGLPLLKAQDENFYKTMLGSKIRDFGTRYTLYKINSEFDSDRLYLSATEKGDFESSVQYKKVNSNKYELQLKANASNKNLVYLDPYYRDWVITMNGKNLPLTQKTIFGYANMWNIPENIFDNKDEVNVDLIFRPSRYIPLAYLVTGLSGALIIWLIIKRN